MEADFNGLNKEIYGNRMMNNVRRHGPMEEEIFSDKGKTADDGALAKTLFFDLARQTRRPASLASIDAANCFDSIFHAIASLIFRAVGVPANAMESMLSAIQNMRYFLRTAYGDSTSYAGSTIDVKFQGLCQGNGAAGAGWGVVSIVIVRCQKRKGFGGKFLCPISVLQSHIAAILLVDDTDLLHINMEETESVEAVHAQCQAGITNWGHLLVASGGAFKPPKCFFYLISFGWDKDGNWFYEPNEQDESYLVAVPMPDGSMAPIDHLAVTDSKEILGVFTCPAGLSEDFLDAMGTKAQDWVARAGEGKLRRRDIWFLMDHQLWPSAGYSLSSCLASWDDLDKCLDRQYWQAIPLGGMVRSAPRALRQLDRGFFGVGCHHPGVECLIGQLNKLIMHYGCPSFLGLEIKASLELFILELGVTPQPLQESYSCYHDRVTHCWLTRLWEKVSKFHISVSFLDVPVKPPRANDK